jgi:biopolymer transport protein TolR
VPKVQPAAAPQPGRYSRGRRVASSLAEINVVPLVDVMLVLLVIFMVTAPMIQRGIDVNLPVARRAAQMTGERIEVTVPVTYRDSHMVYLGSEAIRADVLQERVRQKIEHASQKDVYLRGDGGVLLKELMEITDKLKEAGVEHVGIEAKMPGER